jgi:predicted PurR-regulated permease PerM
MQTARSKTAGTDALVGLWAIALASFVMATLYFARDFLIPLALAALLTFLLSPLVTRIERWLGRITAVLLVGAMILAATVGAGWVLTRQLVDLAAKLPDYKENIQTKLRSIKVPTGGVFTRFSETVEELRKDLPGAESLTPAAAKPQTPVAVTPRPVPAAASVQVVEPSSLSPTGLVQYLIAPLLGPLGKAALVVLLVIFMLLRREDLRRRLIRLIGKGHISAATHAMEDAGARVSRYLLMQLVVNVCYGIPVAIGLYFIGVPNAVLWGAFAAVLRFIPYIGPWIGAALPITLSLAVSPNWTMPLLAIGLFIILELLSNNLMEPWLYSSSTGVTPIALIVAAVFWTWLWGPVGLILSTPLTVCLVVIGRNVPRLSFLSIVLSDEEALTPAEDFYHRLLTIDERDELEFVEAYLKANSVSALYDSVFIPVVSSTETDHRLELLDDEQRLLIEQSLHDIIEDLGTRPPAESKLDAIKIADEEAQPIGPARPLQVYCLPARADRDELAGAMLIQLLQKQGLVAQSAPANLPVGELLDRVARLDPQAACISVVSPSTVIQARYLCVKLKSRFPGLKIVVGLWGLSHGVTEATKRLRESGANEIVTSLNDAVVQLTRNATKVPERMIAEPVSEDVEGRRPLTMPDLSWIVARRKTIHPKRMSTLPSTIDNRLSK